MLIPNHPDDERLAALASADPEATGDGRLVAHVDGCERCTTTIAELRTLRAALAELPDLVPSRPLQFVPPVEEPAAGPAERAATWVRRVFGPVVAVGATAALVGAVGTASPVFMAASQSSAGGADEGDPRELRGEDTFEGIASEAPAEQVPGVAAEGDPETDDHATGGDGSASLMRDALERPPWPMLLFSGIALVILALLLRWIVVPRAG